MEVVDCFGGSAVDRGLRYQLRVLPVSPMMVVFSLITPTLAFAQGVQGICVQADFFADHGGLPAEMAMSCSRLGGDRQPGFASHL